MRKTDNPHITNC